ncbi:MAG: zinc-dependent metalloprotease [Actinobacteria bacterium]|nr:zinc-dependent metalloprotease [Actinomycetota bacterium]
MARRFSGDGSALDEVALEVLVADLQWAVPRSEELVGRATGIDAPAPVPWSVVDRGAWAEANIAGMTVLLAPLTEKVTRRMESIPWPARFAQKGLVSAEVGVLLGYISRRVLGQYDVLVAGELASAASGPRRRPRKGPRGVAGGTVLYFVGPNMVETQRRFDFVPREFALWVALHEVTHRFQFAGVPWLQERFFNLVETYLDSVDLDARQLASRLKTAAARVARGEVPADERNPAYLLSTPEQRVMLDDLQALMAVVEGHGNYIMDTVGAEVIPSFRRMRATFEGRRRQSNVMQRAVGHLIGLEMKLKQYELGQRFCEHVVGRSGRAALDRLWSDPGFFPELAELREPERWLARTGA